MSYAENPYQNFGMTVDRADVETRADFIRKTYLHLAGAIFAFVAIEAAVFASGIADGIVARMGNSAMSWLLVLGGFMLVSWVAESWARSATSLTTQYCGLLLYVIAQAVIFVPLLYLARALELRAAEAGQSLQIIMPAAAITLVMFGGLTAIVFITAKDFTFLRTALWLGSLGAFALIIGGAIFGFNLGLFFSVGMIVLACGWILYQTSAVMHHYQVGQHVAAALALFAAVALLFWYVLRIVIALSGRD